MTSVAIITAALLLADARAIQTFNVASNLSSCEGEECMVFMDDVHFSPRLAAEPHYAHMGRKTPASDGLYSVSCRRGSTHCQLNFDEVRNVIFGTPLKPGEQSVRDVMLEAGTDKVSGHQYSPIYQDFLGHLSKQGADPFTFVEVGFATGRSAHAWAKVFPSARVHEFEVGCDQGWNIQHTSPNKETGPHRDLGYCWLHCGDGTSASFLEESLKNVPAPLVAVDDGGHGPTEMQDFFLHMWPRLQPGGLFFVEDLAESYAVPSGFVETMVKPLVRDLMGLSSGAQELSKDLEYVECREQICVFKKAAH